MENYLRFQLKRLRHPYPHEISSSNEEWGLISIKLLRNQESIALLETQWNIRLLIDWFYENQQFIKSEELIICQHFSPSISESLTKYTRNLLDRNFSEDEEDLKDRWYQEIFNFREHHALASALRGANIADIFIGVNHGKGEISLCSHDENWSHEFNMNEFLIDFQKEVYVFNNALDSF